MEDQDFHGAGDDGWQTVKYRKKERNKKVNGIRSYSSGILNNDATDNHDVFNSVKKHDEKSQQKLDAKNTENNDGTVPHVKNGTEKKKKEKEKDKKKRMTFTAAQIDAADISAFLAKVTASNSSQEDIQLTRFTDYFGQAFSAVSAAQFHWLKLFNDSPLDEIVKVPLCHISESVYKISSEWIDKHSNEGLKSLVIWSLNRILSDMSMQKALSMGPQIGAHNTSSQSQVAMLLVLSIVLRRKPGVLINCLTILHDDPKYQGQDKLPLFSWMIAQAAEGDISVGLYVWARHLLPVLGGKAGSNPKTRDLVLQVVERIVSTPNARKLIMSKGATRNGERLIPTSALELLLRLSFPSHSGRVKVQASERFEAIYPILIYVALYGSPRGKELKQLSQQIQPLLLNFAGEDIPDLSQEAAKLFIWCLIQTPDCYNHWGKMYMNNLKASVIILGRLRRGWNIISPKLSDLSTFRFILKGFREKNKKASGEGMDVGLIKESDEYCHELLKTIFREKYRWMAIILFCIIWILLGVAIFYFWF